jgi:hypothetical protein
MDLLDRYLQAVKKHLPWQRQDDIIAELRSNLESQLDDKQAELGRPLTTGEMEDWLRQMGSPIQVAARYQPQQYLIGPAVFPTYRYVLQLACFWVFIAYSVVTAVQIVAGDLSSGTVLLRALLRAPGVLITTAACVTIVFAVIEFVGMRYSSKHLPFSGFGSEWSPGELPPIEEDTVTGKKRRSYAMAVAEVISSFLFLVWLLLVPGNPWLLLGPGVAYLHASPYELAPVWLQFFWCVVALNILQLGWRFENLWRGKWQQTHPLQGIVMKSIGLISLLLLLTARDHACVVLKHPALDLASYGARLDAINNGIHRGLLIACIIVVLQLAWEIGHISFNSYRKRAAAVR